MRAIGWLLACSLLTGCQGAPASKCQLALAALIPFTVQQGHMVIAPRLNGAPTNMVVDTGAMLTLLSTTSADRLGLRLEAQPRSIEGVGGSRPAYAFVARQLELGRLRGRNFRLEAADFSFSSKGHIVDGLFGADFLAAYDVDLDIAGRKLHLFKTRGTCQAPATDLGGELYAIPMAPEGSYDARPHIRVQIDGRTLIALLDTGAPASVIFRNAAGRLGLNFATLTQDTHFHASGIGPSVRDAVRHVLTPVSIGELTVSHLPVAIVDQQAPQDADMLLGMDFLSRVHAWFSFSTRSMILQYPPLPSPVPPAATQRDTDG